MRGAYASSFVKSNCREDAVFKRGLRSRLRQSPPRRGLRYTLYMGTGGVTGALIGGRAARAAAILGGALLGFIVADNSGGGKLPDLTLKPGHRLHLKFGEDLQMSLSSDRPASFDSSAERRLLRYVRYGDRGVCE